MMIFNLVKQHFFLLELGLISLILGFISNYIIHKLIKRYYIAAGATPTRIIISALQRAFYLIFPLIFFSFFASLFNLTTTSEITETLVKILLSIAFCLAAIKLLDYIDIWLERKKNTREQGLNYGALLTRAYILKKILATVIIFITISLILLNFPAVKEVGKGILISAGVLGGMLAFAAQKVFTNFFSGLDFIFNKPISVGDLVAIDSELGNIEKITLNQIQLRTWDSRLVVYPLAYFNEKPFQNLSHIESGLKGTVIFFTDFSVSIEHIRQVLTATLEKSSFWDKKTNSLQVVDMNENCMQLRAVVGAKNNADLWNLRCEVREKLIQYLQKNSSANFPKRKIRLENLNKTPASAEMALEEASLN